VWGPGATELISVLGKRLITDSCDQSVTAPLNGNVQPLSKKKRRTGVRRFFFYSGWTLPFRGAMRSLSWGPSLQGFRRRICLSAACHDFRFFPTFALVPCFFTVW